MATELVELVTIKLVGEVVYEDDQPVALEISMVDGVTGVYIRTNRQPFSPPPIPNFTPTEVAEMQLKFAMNLMHMSMIKGLTAHYGNQAGD